MPPRDAKAFSVPAGHFFRIVSIEGPQVGDLNLWNEHDLRSASSAARPGRCMRRIHDRRRLWSSLPHLRPMATITQTARLVRLGRGRRGRARRHRHPCDPYTNLLLKGSQYHHCCHSNLTRALAAQQDMPLLAAEPHVHDVLNVFMCTGFTRDTHQYFMKASPVRPGDFIEFFAEIDLLCALSACPGGDCSAGHSTTRRNATRCRSRSASPRRMARSQAGGRRLPTLYSRSHGGG